jgi:ABC transporter with metal-binding/Fe-S-binding domain ATP-binding protein
MKVGILFSGGKDSTYAAWLAKKQGHEIECFITLFSENKYSYMFHTPAIELTKKQAELMGIPLVTRETLGEKEKELKDLKRAIEKAKIKYNIQAIVTGALASKYQAERIGKICSELGLECINPLWERSPEEHWREMIKNGFRIILTSVSAEGLGKEWIGREINNASLDKLIELSRKYQFNLAFEGGEAETFVISCPLFKEKLKVELIDIEGENNSWRGILKVR